MIELDEKDIRTVANARFFRKFRWKMLASIVPFVAAWAIGWILLVGEEAYLPDWPAIVVLALLMVVIFAPAIYWDRRQRREVNQLVREWKGKL